MGAKKMKRKQWLLFLIGITGLFCVRIYEDTLFYDPFLSYFKGILSNETWPVYDEKKLLFFHGLRCLLNTQFSLLILQALFNNTTWTKQGALFMLGGYFFIFLCYWLGLQQLKEKGLLLIFNLRKFILHPLFLLLIIPVYYHRKKGNKS